MMVAFAMNAMEDKLHNNFENKFYWIFSRKCLFRIDIFLPLLEFEE
jgi:hypothetical protein